mmetsp:Transcript_125390/g.227452  ORF Transcript_125390/g.227452 Transcript_125390/m.227452 type:complete len:89 (+) Transcript_125390:874-1140(+)
MMFWHHIACDSSVSIEELIGWKGVTIHIHHCLRLAHHCYKDTACCLLLSCSEDRDTETQRRRGTETQRHRFTETRRHMDTMASLELAL